jgi:hypothetical protein
LKETVNERRKLMIDVFLKTWSLKSAVKAASTKFHVRETALRVDWGRRPTWPRQVLDYIGNPSCCDLYFLGIHKTLGQIEHELACCTNPSCRVGLLKTKAEIFFKLIEIRRSAEDEALVKKIEAMESKLKFLVSEKQKEEAKGT